MTPSVKKYISTIVLISIFFIGIAIPSFAGKVEPIENPVLLNLAKTLPMQGILHQDKNGYTYLKVSTDYINKLFPLLESDHWIKDKNTNGAHITLINPSKVYNDHLFGLVEIDKMYHFKVIGVDKIITRHCFKKHDGKKIWYVLEVELPELNEFITKYNLSKSLRFPHISIAYKQEVDFNKPCKKSFRYKHKKNYSDIEMTY